MEKFHIITYKNKLKNCLLCNSILESCLSEYYRKDNTVSKVTHKQCIKCKQNYIKDNLYFIISENGRNPNVMLENDKLLDKSTQKINEQETKEYIPSASIDKIPITVYEGNLKECPKCKNRLIPIQQKSINWRGKEIKRSFMKCEACDRLFFSFNSYNNITDNGREANHLYPFYKNSHIVIKMNDKKGKSSLPKENRIVKASQGKVLTKEELKQKQKEVMMKSLPRIQPKIITLDGVYVYKSINIYCNRNHPKMVKQIPLKLKSAKDGIPSTVYGFYCEQCNKKFITIERITKYTSKCYTPQFRCILDDDLDGNMKQFSELALYGYNVQEGKLSERQRQGIIDFVIDFEIMTPARVISLLEFNINLRKNNPKMQDACEKWHRDISYVQSIHRIE